MKKDCCPRRFSVFRSGLPHRQKKQVGRAITPTRNISMAKRFFSSTSCRKAIRYRSISTRFTMMGRAAGRRAMDRPRWSIRTRSRLPSRTAPNNAGTGTIKRVGDGVIISIKATRVARFTLRRLLQGKHSAKAGAIAPMWEGPLCPDRAGDSGLDDQIPRATDR